MLCKATWYLNHLKSEIDTSILSAHWTHVWVVFHGFSMADSASQQPNPDFFHAHTNLIHPHPGKRLSGGASVQGNFNILCGMFIHFEALMQSSMTKLWGSLHIPYCYFFTATMFKCFRVASAVFCPSSLPPLPCLCSPFLTPTQQ